MFTAKESHTNRGWFSCLTGLAVEDDFGDQSFRPNGQPVGVFLLHLHQVVPRTTALTVSNRDRNHHHAFPTALHCLPIIWIKARHDLVCEEIGKERLECSNGAHTLID